MKFLQIARLALFSAVLAAGHGVICTAANLVLNVPTASDYVTVPDADSLDLMTTFTLEGWVNLSTETDDDQTIVSKRRSINGTGYALVVGKGKLSLGMNNDTGDGQGINFALESAEAIEPGTWYHVAGTYDGAQARVFINGSEAAAFPVQMTLLNSTLPVTIGQQALPGDPRPFIGQIDEVRIWNIARTAEEILAGMNRKLTGHEPNLVGYWNFDSGSAVDLTSFRNNGALIGEAQIVAGPEIFDERERPVFTAGRFSPVGGFRFLFQSMNAGSAFQIEASTDLANWSPVGFTINLQQPGSVELTDPTATNFINRFYRARSTQ